METLSLLATRKNTNAGKLAKNSKFFKTVIKAIQEKKGENIISLDLRKIPEAMADFFVICQATSTTQVKAIADFVEHKVKEDCGETPYRHEGHQAMQWVLVDYVNIVVHVMQPEIRKFYALEELWSDAGLTEHNDI